MEPSTLIELFGYLGSTMVVVSMLMSSVVKLRILNTAGSVISGTYALIIGSFPLALMNICLVAINLYNLRKLLVTKQQYDLVACGKDDGVIRYFLRHYAQDLKVYFPDFQGITPEVDVVYLVMCNAEPAGILLGKALGNGTLEALVEYTTPTYRDCSIGTFLYGALPAEGIREILVPTAAAQHKSYLEKMGYNASSQGFRKALQESKIT